MLHITGKNNMRQERRVAIDQRDLTSSCISLFFFCSIRSLPIHAFCLSRHHTPSYNLSLCAAALTITSWVARPPGAHHKQQQAHAILLLILLISRCFDLIEPASRPPCSVLMCFVLVVLYLTVQVGRVRGSNALSHPWNFDPFSFLMLRCMGLGYSPFNCSARAPPF